MVVEHDVKTVLLRNAVKYQSSVPFMTRLKIFYRPAVPQGKEFRLF